MALSAPTLTASSTLAAQAAIADTVASLIASAVASTNLVDTAVAIEQLKMFTAGVVAKYGQASAVLAVHQYLAARSAAGITARFDALPAPTPPLEQIGKTVDWATAPLAQSGVSDPASVVKQRMTGSTERLVLLPARDTIVSNVRRDRHARGWERVTEPGCCAFCAMLATRGAVYRSENTSEFQAHNNCRCIAEPDFGAWEPSEQVKEWRQLWADVTPVGKSNAQTIAAWRTAYDAKYLTSPTPEGGTNA